MATKVALDDTWIDEALKLGGRRTKYDGVTQALRDYVQRREPPKLIELLGTVDFDEILDAKAQHSFKSAAIAATPIKILLDTSVWSQSRCSPRGFGTHRPRKWARYTQSCCATDWPPLRMRRTRPRTVNGQPRPSIHVAP